MSVLSILKNSGLRLSKSERKVSEVILADPEAVIRAPISSIARKAGVSEPTVNRFCRSLDCKGFPDFKVKLAQDLAQGLAQGLPSMTRDVEAGDSTNSLIDKIFESTHASLHTVQSECNNREIDKAAEVLSQARSIVFFGIGASGPVALDAQHKFLRFDIPVIAHTDVMNQRLACTALGEKDVVVCISYTGRTIALTEAAQLAADNGATVIGITTGDSPLAKICSIVLAMEIPEDTDIYTPMTSRIAHLVLIDILATAAALKRGPRFSQHLKQVKEVLRDTRHIKDEYRI